MADGFQLKARHRVLSILFLASIVSFVDRTAMTVALPFIRKDFGLTAIESGFVISAFFASYSIAQIPGGLLVDRFGIRKVTTVALLWWSVFTGITGSIGGFVQMLVARFFFGLGEGVFPICTFKTVAVWFPKRSRGTANAIMLSSSRLGQAIAPLPVIWIIAHLGGWRSAFLGLCLPGLVIAALFWLLVPNSPAEGRGVSRADLDELDEDADGGAVPGAPSVSAWVVLRDTVVLRYMLIYFVFDFAFWGFTSWFPTYLVEERGFSALQMGVAASLPALSGTLGCIFGGWISDRLFRDNRRLPVIVSPVLSALFLYLTLTTSSVTMVMLYQTISGLLLNVFFAAFWALPISTVPKERMGITSGVINTGGQLAGAISPIVVGALVSASGGRFGVTFGVLVVALILVGAIAMTLPGRVRPRPGDPIAV